MKIRFRKHRLYTRGALAEVGSTENELWRDKRQRQARDWKAVRDGRITGGQLRWFRGGEATRVRLVGSPL